MVHDTQPHESQPTETQQEERPKSEYELGHDDPNPLALAAVGIAGVLAIYLIIVGAMGFYLYFEQQEIERKVYAAPHVEFEDYRTARTLVLVDPQAAADREADADAAAELRARLAIDEAVRLARYSVVGKNEDTQTQLGE